MAKKKMPPSILVGLWQSLGVTVYCASIALLFWFIKTTNIEPPEILGFLAMLSLFVFSAAVTGLLVFGYATYLVINKDFKEALNVIGYTLLFAIITVAVLFLAVFTIQL